MASTKRWFVLFSIALSTPIAASACGSSDNGQIAGGAATSGGGKGGKGGGGSGGSITLGGGPNLDGSAGGGGISEDASCANVSVDADRIPLAMYIMQDKSGSMKGQKWADVTTALQQFVNDPSSAGIKVALQFFSGSGPCDGSVYDTPAVPMGALPANGPAIVQAVQGVSPSGNTPMEGAMRGLDKFTKSYAAANPTDKTIALLVTDGLPNGCNEDPTYLDGLAGASFSQAPSVLFFVMGMSGADFTQLDQFAQAGGTNKAYDVSNGGAQAFLNALQTIAGSVLGCEYTMPTTDAGTIDPNKIVINYTPGGGSPQALPKVSDASACGSGDGFYYDNPTNPTKISLCPTTCNAVQGDTQGKIQILLGCALGSPA